MALMLCIPFAQANAMTLVTIPLKYRTAQAIIPAIKPMMPLGSTISGQNYTLIVRSSEKNIAQIRYMLRSLDTPLRTLIISVRQGGAQRGRLQASIGPGIKVYQSTSANDHQDLQSVRVLEGHSAFINTGKSIPVIGSVGFFGIGNGNSNDSRNGQGNDNRDRRGNVNHIANYDGGSAIYYKDVSTGFYVTPTLQAGQVLLSIAKHRENLSRDGGGKIRFDRTQTTMTLPLGRWVKFGSSSDAVKSHRNNIVYQTGDRSNEKSHLYIKVDIVN